MCTPKTEIACSKEVSAGIELQLLPWVLSAICYHCAIPSSDRGRALLDWNEAEPLYEAAAHVLSRPPFVRPHSLCRCPRKRRRFRRIGCLSRNQHRAFGYLGRFGRLPRYFDHGLSAGDRVWKHT